MDNMIFRQNTKSVASYIFGSVMAGLYGMYVFWEYIKEEERYYSSGNELLMVTGIMMMAVMFYGFYSAHVLSSQYIEISAGTVTGTGLDQSFLMRAKPFTCKVSQITRVGVVSHLGARNCLELKIDGEIPVVCHVQDVKQAGIAINSLLKQREAA